MIITIIRRTDLCLMKLMALQQTDQYADTEASHMIAICELADLARSIYSSNRII